MIAALTAEASDTRKVVQTDLGKSSIARLATGQERNRNRRLLL